MSLVAQMNVRMDGELQHKGTAALAEIGLTPSEAVRRLWQKAAKRGTDLAEVSQLLTGKEALAQRSVKLAIFDEGQQLVRDSMEFLGIPLGSEAWDRLPPYEELVKEAHLENLREEGFFDE